MAGDYTRLFHSFFDSSIREESAETRIVFLAMIAKSDQAGIVRSTVRALSDFARVPFEATVAALDRLQLPDPDSTSQEEEGRRILLIAPNVWQVVNYRHYYELSRKEERKEQVRVAVQKHRSGNQVKSEKITENNGNLFHTSVSVSESVSEEVDGGVGEDEDALDDGKKSRLPEPFRPHLKERDVLAAKEKASGVDDKYLKWQTDKFTLYWKEKQGATSRKSILGWRRAWLAWIDNSIFRYGELDAFLKNGTRGDRRGSGSKGGGSESPSRLDRFRKRKDSAES